MLDGVDAALMYECLACGLLYLGIEPSTDQLAHYYSDYWLEDYVVHRELHEPGLRQRHAHLLSERGSKQRVEDFIARVRHAPEQSWTLVVDPVSKRRFVPARRHTFTIWAQLPWLPAVYGLNNHPALTS
jgi:hypothetical protein